MSHALFTVSVVDLDEGSHGELAAKFIVDSENEKRAAFAELVPSYLAILEATLDRAHVNYIIQQATQQSATDQLDARWLQASEAERNAALTALPEATEH